MAKREEIVEASADMYDPEKGRTVQDTMRTTDLAYQLRQLGGVQNLPVFGQAGEYADVSEVGDFRQALEAVQRARDAFMAQPALLRERFQNDPGQFLEFCMDPGNRDEAVSLGLIEAPVKAAVEPPVVAPAK